LDIVVSTACVDDGCKAVFRSCRMMGHFLHIDRLMSRERVVKMADDSDMVYPTGLTPKQAEEIQEGLMWGTRIYAGIAIAAHVLAYIYSPWLHS